jgi:RNase adapter protein RapZ
MTESDTQTGPQGAASDAQSIILVSGASGAGRTTAIRALEDFGFEVIDNLPLGLVPRLVDGPPLNHPLALGIDVRTRGFSVDALIETHDALSAKPGLDVQLLYLDCRPDILTRRYSETRRHHPLAQDGSAAEGVDREVELLKPLRARADVLIDTSDLTVHDLKAELRHWLGLEEDETLTVSVQSFSYKRGVPRGLDLVFDVRFLNNPHWQAELQPLTGLDARVADYVAEDPRYPEFFERVSGLISFLLPAYAKEGKAHLNIGFGCSGGRHRSVALTEAIAKTLADTGWRVSIRHREIECPAEDGPADRKRGTLA